IHVEDSLKFTTPKGKVVYGGGGIIPDVFVPRDINYKKESLDYMLKGDIMDRFVFNQLDKNRPYFNSLSLAEFDKDIAVSDEINDDFRDYLSEFRIRFKPEEYKEL